MLARVDQLNRDIAEVDAKIEELIAPFTPAVERLNDIPGIGHIAASIILSEIGLDMSRFPTAGHLACWARFAPTTKESAGRKKGRSATGYGNPYLARVLGEAAVSAGKTNTFLGERYRRIARRRGKKRAIVAVGRSILTIVWHLLSDPRPASSTWAPTLTTPAPAPNARNAPTSASSKPSATESSWNPSPDQLA
ncbi:transposase [Nonomuraea fuscirosea]|uniref:transposase n=1 Tax=Nonomuraea fuscirosea TaxID=1291556 RepID=UPI00342F5306